MKTGNYIYFVEGENEKKLVQVLKSEFGYIQPGKILVHNVLTRPITSAQMRQFLPGTAAVCIFDTDIDHLSLNIFEQNIRSLRNQRHIKDVIMIPQVKNIEDELVRSTSVRDIRDLLQSRSGKDFKRDFNQTDLRRLKIKLEEADFNIGALWSMTPCGVYSRIRNDAARIKTIRS